MDRILDSAGIHSFAMTLTQSIVEPLEGALNSIAYSYHIYKAYKREKKQKVSISEIDYLVLNQSQDSINSIPTNSDWKSLKDTLN